MSGPRISLGRAHAIASSMIADAEYAGIGLDTIVAVGGLRRFAPVVDEVALLGVAREADHASVQTAFARLPMVRRSRPARRSSMTVETTHGPVTLHLSVPGQLGAALVWHTGSSAHVDHLRVRAGSMGLQFTAATVRGVTSPELACESEHALYAMLGLPFIAPELRNGSGEIEAAERGHLPALVSERDIRGDLHTHSNWSDGRHAVADMVGAAVDLGYEYVAITDHSERAPASRTLQARDVSKQRQEIDALRHAMPHINILHGVEVDIMSDGSLDFDDDLLEQFDIVLASLHDGRGDARARLTERYLRAIRHPLVNVITHPTNRVPGRFDGYPLDLDRLFAAAAETGTAMEVDGAPGHLDMDGTVARRAAAAGVTIVIDSDCHRVERLGIQMEFGVGTARRGWIGREQVLNTGGADEIRAFVERKRAPR
ncbi:MAG: PHP domain-containing protein [Acidobacteria bacterium]|nr:PHP domain-containing protein [Acidobacteriota bacterium]